MWDNILSLRKKELYWINRENTSVPNGLNVREVSEEYNQVEKKKLEKDKLLYSHNHDYNF